MKKEKYGFVYIWYDRKHKRYYIGCHWGCVDDGYICSSKWMIKSYKRRPTDFRRKILKSHITTKQDTVDEEYNYLSKIKDHELGKRYYNLTNHKNGHWSTKDNAKTVGEKISASPNRAANISKALTGKKLSEETKQKLREANLGRTLSEEIKSKIAENHNRNYDDPIFKENMSRAAKNRSAEHRQKIAENNRRLQAEGKIGMKGRKHSEETKQKMAIAAMNRQKNNKENNINGF